MVAEYFATLFNYDEAFIKCSKTGFTDSIRNALRICVDQTYASDEFKKSLKTDFQNFKEYSYYLQELCYNKIKIGSFGDWHILTVDSEKLADSDPVSATMLSLLSLAAWNGAVGEEIFEQNAGLCNKGWYIFPLALIRNSCKANAFWAPKMLLRKTIEFISSGKYAPFDAVIKRFIDEYQKIQDKIDIRYNDYLNELVWDIQTSLNPDLSDNFRGEIASVFWTLGFIVQAYQLKDNNVYIPSFLRLKKAIHYCIETIHFYSLIQYIFLEMKDKPPFNIRNHKVLFPVINSRYYTQMIHQMDESFPIIPSQIYARALIAYFKNSTVDDPEIGLKLESIADIISPNDESIAFQFMCLHNLICNAGINQVNSWRYLAKYANSILHKSSILSFDKKTDKRLDIPYFYLETNDNESLENLISHLEISRGSGIYYWLVTTPPLIFDRKGEVNKLLEKEQYLLADLRGAHFIREMKNLPTHYRRYSFVLTDALDGPIPEGAKKSDGPLKFDPFDSDFALSQTKKILSELDDLYKQISYYMPQYSSIRTEPIINIKSFSEYLQSHKT